jgi:hypothetical protein
MTFPDRLFNRPLAPSLTREIVRRQSAPMTAHEAWAFAKPRAGSLDPEAKLVLITSGTDMQADGRSFTWEFLFHLHRRKARVLLTYAPADDAADPEQAPIMMVERITTATDPAGMAALPWEFRDSPGVVAELSRSGVDFVAGPTDLKLEARVGATGQAVWTTYYWNEARSVAFSTPAS